MSTRTAGTWARKVATADWAAAATDLDRFGGALLPRLLTTEEASAIRDLYGRDEVFRSTIDMSRHRFGCGEYRYFDTPYPQPVDELKPGVDHTGGEFLLVEQRPRAQSRGTATLLPHGHGYVCTTRDRPVRTARGWSAAPVRHGVSAIRSGERHTLALVFHDAA
ncbi:MAG: hypothetical protein HOQ22_13795 [Nocardioidaceae bacterium]|nr:hypothetical protein [Nocardioidaceae bacterium]NUS52097.1 hypothetical protein [Nocardioidaceae bacterium]